MLQKVHNLHWIHVLLYKLMIYTCTRYSHMLQMWGTRVQFTTMYSDNNHWLISGLSMETIRI